MIRHGWFKLPGQRGDRALEDQLRGLDQALAGAKGKTILDLGCAEGAIALEFARRGASRILGLEIVAGHVDVARALCAGHPCEFACMDLNNAGKLSEKFDVVLALAILHKLKDPARILRHVGSLARELVVIRIPSWGQKWRFTHARGDGRLIDCALELAPLGFSLERIERGPRSEGGLEPVVYFRRRRV